MQLSLFGAPRLRLVAQRPTCIQPVAPTVGALVVDRSDRGFVALVNRDRSRTLLAWGADGECIARRVESWEF